MNTELKDSKYEYMATRPKSPGRFQVNDIVDGLFVGSFDVVMNSASGLMCKALKTGGSLQCPGFSDWSKYLWTRIGC
jgi:hypothetical protein